MATLNLIDKYGLSEKVIRLSATLSARQIVEVLKKEDGKSISQPTISKYIQEVRQERQEATKAVIAETVTPGLTSDLAFFDEMLETYRELFRTYTGKYPDKEIGLGGEKLKDSPKVDPIGLIAVGKEYRATVESKVKIAGGNMDGEDMRKGYINIDIDRV
jgi:hypothetical protein